MPAQKGLEWTFDTVAAAYEKLRPGYVDELYQTIFDYIPIDENSSVVEVGSCGGQATAPMLKTGCRLTVVECGRQFSELLRERFREYSDFSVVTDKFENVEFPDGAFDLVYSASAFHWVPEEIGYKKAFSMLKSGGAFARFANHPYRDRGNPELSTEIDAIYDEYYYTYYNKMRKPMVEYTQAQAKERALTTEKYSFSDIRYKMFYRERRFTAKNMLRCSEPIQIILQLRRRFERSSFQKSPKRSTATAA